MAQYLVFLAMAPAALVGVVIALLLPRIVHSYQRFAWLRGYNYCQLMFLLINTSELLAGDPEAKRILAAIDYVFVGGGASMWFLFSLEYTGLLRRRRPWQALLFIVPVLCCLAGLIDGLKWLLWRDLSFSGLGWITVMRTGGYGPLAFLMFIQAYSLTLAGAWMVIRMSVASHRLYQKQTAWMLVGVALPTLSNLLFITKTIPGWNKDYSALAGALGAFCFTFGCLRYRLFSVVPVSRQTIVDQMRLGMIVTDTKGLIVDLNQTACRMIGKSELALLGMPADPVEAALESRYELTRQPLLREERIEAWHIEVRERGESEHLPDPYESPILSLGELRVVEMLALRLSNKEIADRLGLSIHTVKFHLANVFRKTGASNRSELVGIVAKTIRN